MGVYAESNGLCFENCAVEHSEAVLQYMNRVYIDVKL